MSDKVDKILDSGCLEKLLENEKVISSKDELSTYLEENGFSEICDADLEIIFSQIEQLYSSGGVGIGYSQTTYKDVKVKFNNPF